MQHRTDRYQCLEEMPKGINEIYEAYCGMSDSPVPKKKFKEILLSFNESIMEHIINGGEFNMGFNLSMLSVLRAKVNPRLAKIDWKTSNELKKDLEEKVRNLDQRLGKMKVEIEGGLRKSAAIKVFCGKLEGKEKQKRERIY